MRMVLLPISFLISLLMTSCDPAAYLVTDPTFAMVGPGVTEAWAALAPLRNAQSRTVETGDPTSLERVLSSLPAGSPVLVAVLMSSRERAATVRAHPDLGLRFVGPPDPAVKTLSVDREEAWATVARKAAGLGAGTAWALFPEGTSSAQADRFAETWKKAGGGPLEIRIWPDAGRPPEGTGPVFNWVGPEADAVVTVLSSDRSIHGDPGTSRAPGGTGLSWTVKKEGLGPLLWEIVRNSTKNTEILPLETTVARR